MLTIYESVLSPDYQHDNYGYYQQPQNRSNKKDWILPAVGLAGAGAAGYWLYNRYGHDNEVARQEQDAAGVVGAINQRMSAEHELNRMKAAGASAADIQAQQNKVDVARTTENQRKSQFGLNHGDTPHPETQTPPGFTLKQTPAEKPEQDPEITPDQNGVYHI